MWSLRYTTKKNNVGKSIYFTMTPNGYNPRKHHPYYCFAVRQLTSQQSCNNKQRRKFTPPKTPNSPPHPIPPNHPTPYLRPGTTARTSNERADVESVNRGVAFSGWGQATTPSAKRVRIPSLPQLPIPPMTRHSRTTILRSVLSLIVPLSPRAIAPNQAKPS